MPEPQVSKTNGAQAPVVASNEPTLAELQAQLLKLVAENNALREAAKQPVVNTGASYGIIPPGVSAKTGKHYDTSVKIALSSGGQLIGGRRKMLEIVEEVQSGRLPAFLNAHPEVK